MVINGLSRFKPTRTPRFVTVPFSPSFGVLPKKGLDHIIFFFFSNCRKNNSESFLFLFWKISILRFRFVDRFPPIEIDPVSKSKLRHYRFLRRHRFFNFRHMRTRRIKSYWFLFVLCFAWNLVMRIAPRKASRRESKNKKIPETCNCVSRRRNGWHDASRWSVTSQQLFCYAPWPACFSTIPGGSQRQSPKKSFFPKEEKWEEEARKCWRHMPWPITAQPSPI